MIRAWHNMQFSRHARSDQAPRILDILVDEEIDPADYDESGRKASQVLHAGGDSSGGNFG